MNNNENYKKAIDQIHAPEDLKQKTLQKMKENRNRKKFVYLKYLSACAVILIAFALGIDVYKDAEKIPVKGGNTVEPVKTIKISNAELPRFKDMEELKSVLKEKDTVYFNMAADISGSRIEIAEEEKAMEATDSANSMQKEDLNYSKTNTQVENVDEADIVKTDGKYIYYITQNQVHIIEAKDLKEIYTFDLYNESKRFTPYEMYVKENRLVIIGNYYEIEKIEERSLSNYSDMIFGKDYTQALVYNVENHSNPELIRTVRLDGGYRNSRMIGDNVYLIVSSSAYYNDTIKDNEILPRVYDSLVGEKTIQATDIAYFRDTESHSFMTVAGFDVNGKEEVCTETFFGASETIYASKNNLYITQVIYKNGWYSSVDTKNVIYKFKLDGSNIALQYKGEVKGYLNNQFSMDEYNGNLRIATTYYDEDGETRNQLIILDETLKEMSRIDNIAVGEKIYSVRFIGKVRIYSYI